MNIVEQSERSDTDRESVSDVVADHSTQACETESIIVSSAAENTELEAFLLKLLTKKAVVGLSYFDVDGALLQQRQLGGTIVRVTPHDGITLRFNDGKTEFNVPSDTCCWFTAPKGRYRMTDNDAIINNPDFLVTWNIFKTQDKTKPEGEHEWWEWRPNTVAPAVG